MSHELREWKPKRYPRDDYDGDRPAWIQSGGRAAAARRSTPGVRAGIEPPDQLRAEAG